MRRTVLLLVVLGPALVAVLLLLFGPGLGGGGAASRPGEEAPAGRDLEGNGAVAEEARDGHVRAPASPVLFGRPRAERAGRGGVFGKVVAVEDGDPVEGAHLLLTGVGFAKEEVRVRGVTSKGGTFRLPDIPAGDDYVLAIEAEKHPHRVVPSVAVRRGNQTDLGSIWLGETGSLAGRVVDTAGRGVADADVELHPGGRSVLDMYADLPELLANLDRDPVPVARTRSEADGTFRFDGLAPGRLFVLARAHGHGVATRECVVSPPGVAPAPLTLELPDGRTVEGVTVSETGEPIRGVRVAAVEGQDPFSFLYGRHFADTDADGRFQIEVGAHQERLALLALAPGYPMVQRSVPADAKEVRIVLERSTTLSLRFLRTPSEEPLEGAQLLAVVETQDQSPGSDSQVALRGVTDAGGTVVLATPPGRLQMVLLSIVGTGNAMWSPAAGPTQSLGLSGGPSDPTIPPRGLRAVFHLADLVTIRGVVKDEDGRAVPRARVRNAIGILGAEGTTADEDGRYELTLPRSVIVLKTDAPGYVPEMTRVDPAAGQQTVEQDVVLGRSAVVVGRVVDQKGAPVVGAEVRLKGSSLATFGMGAPVESLSSRSGRFVLDGVPPGSALRVGARQARYAEVLSGPFDAGADATVRIGDLVLPRGSRVVVDVSNESGEPVADAALEIDVPHDTAFEANLLELFTSQSEGHTDASGHWQKDHVLPGEATITVSHADYATSTVHVTIPKGADPPPVHVRLARGLVLSGHVLSGTGVPVEGATVVVRTTDPGTPTVASATTGKEGDFRLEHQPRDALAVRVSASGFEPRELDLLGPTEGVEIRLAPADPSIQARRQALQKRAMEILQALQAAKTDAERKALQEELARLGKEMQSLQSGPPGDR